MRMATLADGGRILGPDVAREIARCEASWKASGFAQQGVQTDAQESQMRPGALQLSQYFIEQPVDAFDAAQIDTVLTAIAKTGSMAEAGRLLFAVSRAKRTTTNDTMRVKNFLKQWGLSYQDVKTRLAQLAT
jgi:transcriptional regulatory protein RtcR